MLRVANHSTAAGEVVAIKREGALQAIYKRRRAQAKDTVVVRRLTVVNITLGSIKANIVHYIGPLPLKILYSTEASAWFWIAA